MNLKGSLIIIGIILSALLISGCFLPNQEHNSGISGSYAKYYKGSTGVEANFENLNSRMYYYADGTEDENSFVFGVKVHNEGTSLAKGATFISGYDPNLVFIEGQPIDRDDGWGVCAIDVTSFGDDFSDWAGLLSCTMTGGSSFDFNTNHGYWNGDVNNVGLLLEQIGGWDTPTWLDNFDLSLTGEHGEGVQGFSFDFDAPNGFDIKFMYHGAFLSTIIDRSLPFQAGFGKEYLLAADNQYYPGGQPEYLDYHVTMDEWPRGLEEYPVTFLLTNCYGYATFTSPLVCIDPQPMSQHRKACTPRDMSLTSQGAPVAITRIEQESTRKKSIFTIHIKNIGKGDIIHWGEMALCSPYSKSGILTSKNKNVVQGFEVRIENQGLECTPRDKKIRLNQNGEGIITCMYNLQYTNLQSAYQTPLIIEFWYGYMQTEQRQVLFKRII